MVIDETNVYYLLGDDSNDAFTIDANTGQVTLLEDPNFGVQSDYSFTVLATDEAGNVGDLDVTLSVNNLDEVAPIIVSGSHTTVYENTGYGKVIYTAQAVDSSEDIINSPVRYSLLDDWGIFSINTLSGEVTLYDDLDYEYQSSYQFTVVASDGDGNSSEKTVDVNVVDMEEVIPTPIFPVPTSPYQKVYDDGIVWDGNTGTLVVKYEANAVSSDSTGLGLRIHFDSTSMVVAQSSGVVVESHGALLIGPLDTVPDSGDFDNNVATDSLVGINYVSITGGWPGDAALPSSGDDVVLATLTFEKVEGGNNNFVHDYTASSQPPIYSEFISLPTFPLAPMALVVNAIDENSGAGQVVATVENAPEGATFSLAGGGNEFNIPEQEVNTAHVYVSGAEFSEDGTQLTVKVGYKADILSNGLGLLVHYDGSALSLPETPTVDAFGAIVIGPNLMADEDDGDDSDGTDSVVNVAWTSFMGGWPGDNAVDLLELTFEVADGQTGPFDINFSSSSTPPGVTFAGQNQTVSLPDNTFTINPETGEVTLTIDPDYEAQPEYDIEVVASTGDVASGTYVVGNIEGIEQSITTESSNYVGTVESDIYSLVSNPAIINSGAGEDVFNLELNNEPLSSAVHIINDFEGGVDSIDITAALVAAGYTESDSLTQLMSADMSADILDLINGNDGSLDNMFGGSFDESSNLLTVFADTNSEEGVAEIASYQVEVGDNSTVEDDDITVNFSTFIA
ncbi:MAG: Uncharacterised protein [Cellvibrionales bacterium UBA7375]|nr:MAG: Uncharacterised protein [Cellvibrionales bacterium UBA7375]